jgi:hypothetical protein
VALLGTGRVRADDAQLDEEPLARELPVLS